MDDESLSRLVAVTGPAGSSNVALAAAVASVRDETLLASVLDPARVPAPFDRVLAGV